MDRFSETLYKKDSTGNIRYWFVTVESTDRNNLKADSMIKNEYGTLNGTPTKFSRTISVGKNVGKNNETTPYEQALNEAKADITKKRKEGYLSFTDLEDKSSKGGCYTVQEYLEKYLPNSQTKGIGDKIPAPMLAKKYDNTGKQSDSKTFEQLKLGQQTFFIQPKIDGLRCLCRVTSEYDVEFFSRKGEPFMWLDHLANQVRLLLQNITIEKEIYLDGELYTDKYSFNALNGMLRKTKEKPDGIEDMDYILYDTIKEVNFEDRHDWLRELNFSDKNTPNIKLLETFQINTAIPQLISKAHDKWVDEGHEGLMIRLNRPYENKRTWNLIKVKEFEDSDFLIVDANESTLQSILGTFTVEGTLNGKEVRFNATPKCTTKEKIEMWQNQSSYIGKMCTVEYFGVSEYGIPRFPRITKIYKSGYDK